MSRERREPEFEGRQVSDRCTLYRLWLGSDSYVGSTVRTLDDRLYEHETLLKSGRHWNADIQAAFKSCQQITIERIREVAVEERNAEEKRAIRELKPTLNRFHRTGYVPPSEPLDAGSGLDTAAIANRRKSLGLSQTEAAARAGFKVQYWGFIERGCLKNPRLFTLEKIARVLGCGIDDLVK